MMTPAAQLKYPRETERSLARFLAEHQYESATVTSPNEPRRTNFAALAIQLHATCQATSPNDLIIQLIGWGDTDGPLVWSRPQMRCLLTHEWTFGNSDEPIGSCRWSVTDSNAGFEATGCGLVWDTHATDFPGWFWRDGIPPQRDDNE